MGNKGSTDVQAPVRLYAEPAQGTKLNIPNIRDPCFLGHRRLAHVGDDLYDQTVAAVDGLPK